MGDAVVVLVVVVLVVVVAVAVVVFVCVQEGASAVSDVLFPLVQVRGFENVISLISLAGELVSGGK